MTRASLAAAETGAVAHRELALLAGYARAFGIHDPLVEPKGRALGRFRHAYGVLDAQVPGVEEIQIAGFRAQQLRLGKTAAFVTRGEARNRQSSVNGVRNCLGREIRGACMPALLADVGSHANRFVAVVLDRVYFRTAHGHGLAVAFRGFRFALRRTAP